MKEVFAVVENWYNGPQYPEDQSEYTKIIGIANNMPDAYKIIANRKISVLSYIDTKYYDYGYAVEHVEFWQMGNTINCRIADYMYDDYGDTYIGDCFNWIIEKHNLIGS